MFKTNHLYTLRQITGINDGGGLTHTLTVIYSYDTIKMIEYITNLYIENSSNKYKNNWEKLHQSVLLDVR